MGEGVGTEVEGGVVEEEDIAVAVAAVAVEVVEEEVVEEVEVAVEVGSHSFSRCAYCRQLLHRPLPLLATPVPQVPLALVVAHPGR